jgi:hypothetical protein
MTPENRFIGLNQHEKGGTGVPLVHNHEIKTDKRVLFDLFMSNDTTIVT